MFTRRLLFSLLVLFSVSAKAVVWSDVWWNPNESGWGVNVAQQDTVIYLTFFVYDQNSQPHWYAAGVNMGAVQPNGYNLWNGSVVSVEGPWIGAPFIPANVTGSVVGTATFAPTSNYSATLQYTVNGVLVTKTIQRESFLHIPLSGNYQGGYTISNSNCSALPDGGHGAVEVDFDAQVNSDNVSGPIQTYFAFSSTNSCSVSGEYRQYGSIYKVQNASSCTLPSGLIVDYNDFNVTDKGTQGELQLTGPGNCTAIANFSAAKY